MSVKKPFEQIVNDHGATVLRVCRAVLDAHEADDAWSETFLAAFKAYPALPATANIEAWLVTIAHRKAIDVTRARRRTPSAVEHVPDQESTLGVPRVVDGELQSAVRSLPTKQRQAVAYHYLAGLPHAEIAELLGGSVDAARRAAADGLKSLRKTYAGKSLEGDHR